MIDTHQIVKRLVKKGLPEPVAEEWAEIQKELVVDTLLATKADLKQLRADLTHSLTVRMGLMFSGTVGFLSALALFLRFFTH